MADLLTKSRWLFHTFTGARGAPNVFLLTLFNNLILLFAIVPWELCVWGLSELCTIIRRPCTAGRGNTTDLPLHITVFSLREDCLTSYFYHRNLSASWSMPAIYNKRYAQKTTSFKHVAYTYQNNSLLTCRWWLCFWGNNEPSNPGDGFYLFAILTKVLLGKYSPGVGFSQR